MRRKTDEYGEEAEVVIHSTELALEEFLQSVLWNDMRNEVVMWYTMAAKDYDQAKSMAEIRRAQGIREACEYFIGLPQVLLDAVRAANVKNSQKETDNE